jgi:hypothetical protein
MKAYHILIYLWEEHKLAYTFTVHESYSKFVVDRKLGMDRHTLLIQRHCTYNICGTRSNKFFQIKFYNNEYFYENLNRVPYMFSLEPDKHWQIRMCYFEDLDRLQILQDPEYAGCE